MGFDYDELEKQQSTQHAGPLAGATSTSSTPANPMMLPAWTQVMSDAPVMGQMQLKPPGGEEWLTLDGFAEGNDGLTNEHASKLKAFAKIVLKQLPFHPNAFITITGFSDSIGKHETKGDVAQKRAEAVKFFLTESECVSGEILHASGLGASVPRVEGKKGVPEPRNRRVEITFVPGKALHLPTPEWSLFKLSDILSGDGLRKLKPILPIVPPPWIPSPPEPGPKPSLPKPPSAAAPAQDDDANKIWELDFDLDVEPQSLMGRTLARLHLPLATDAEQARERTKQILKVISGQDAEDTPVGLKLINAGVNILGATPQAQQFLKKLHIDNVSVVFDPSPDERKYGLKVEFKLK
jgi:outer membrane protein OmpA-like peptidoglycan-associated protein